MKKYAGLAIVLAVVAFGAFYITKEKKQAIGQQESASQAANKSKAPTANVKAVKGFENKVVEYTKTEDGAIADYSQYQTAVTQFKQFQQKPLLTSNEKAEFQQLFSKSNIEDAKKMLTKPEGSVNQHVEANHQATVDFLLGAFTENPTAARGAIVEVANNNLSNTQVSQEVRELMAKDKAELLFHALAKDPSLKNDIANADPITQKIIKNIEAEHKRNLAMSAEEVVKFKSGRW